jgi:hypothetical protein
MLKMFYTYLWLRESGLPWYAGKGIGKRAFRRGCPPPDRIILQYWDTEEEAFEAERFLISYYGRKDHGTGCLRNLTDGGDGTSGLIRSEESKHRVRLTRLGKKATEGARRKMSLAHLGKPSGAEGRRHTLESRQKMSLAKLGKKNYHKGVPRSEEAKRKTSLALLGRPCYWTGKTMSQETRDKMRESQRLAWARRRGELT